MDTRSPDSLNASAQRATQAGRRFAPLAWLSQRWHTRPSRFMLEIVIVLAIKVVLLCILKHAFFDAPVAKHMSLPPDDVARALLGPAAVDPHLPTQRQGVRHDQ